MDSTKTKYNFYKKTFKGGAQQTLTETINIQPQPPQQQENVQSQQNVQTETQQQENVQNETQQQENVQTETQDQTIATEGANLEQLNQEIPKNKINFKVGSMVGNLDQTLGDKQKINFDQLFMKQLFGFN